MQCPSPTEAGSPGTPPSCGGIQVAFHHQRNRLSDYHSPPYATRISFRSVLDDCLDKRVSPPPVYYSLVLLCEQARKYTFTAQRHGIIIILKMVHVERPFQYLLSAELNHLDGIPFLGAYDEEEPSAFCDTKKAVRNVVAFRGKIGCHHFTVRWNHNLLVIYSRFDIKRIDASLEIVYSRLHFARLVNIAFVVINFDIQRL